MQNTPSTTETLQNAIEQIPADAWPMIDLLVNIMFVAVGIWLFIAIFVYLRRLASNLTPVNAAQKNRKASPDFLKVDKKARKAAIARGKGFEKELDRREREEARADARARRSNATLGQRIASLFSLFMSLFTLATMIFGAIFNVSRMGRMMKDYSAQDRIMAVVKDHPIAVVIASLVIAYHIFKFFSDRKWKEG